MKITRWLATRKPTHDDIVTMFKDEGFEYIIEELPGGSEVKEHRHPFDEVRMVIAGSMRFNVAGNEFILREGDRLELPSNTRHKTRIDPDTACTTIYAHRVS